MLRLYVIPAVYTDVKDFTSLPTCSTQKTGRAGL